MEAGGKRYVWYGSRSDQISVWNLADLHINTRACALDKIKEDIARIKADRYSFWFGGGDYADCISYTDKRFHPDSVAPEIKVKDMGDMGKVSMGMVRDLFMPIKHKCMGLLFGNHEAEYMKHKEQTGLHGWLCNELGVPDLGYCALVDVFFCRASTAKQRATLPRLEKTSGGNSWQVRFFLHHGSGFATTPGGKLNKLIQFMNNFEADVYMCGHVHDQVGRRQPTIGADPSCNHIISRDKVGVISGSYLKTYKQGTTTYGEQRGYAPVTLGAARVMFVPDKREMRGEI